MCIRDSNNVMVKHIVLFKLKDEVPEAEKLVVMNKFKEAIEALPACLLYTSFADEWMGRTAKFSNSYDQLLCRSCGIVWWLLSGGLL